MEPSQGPFHVEQDRLTAVFDHFVLSPKVRTKLREYCSLLDHARLLGLVGFGPDRDPEQLARALLLDARLLDGQVVDVGAGAGLPGIPLACLGRPVTLVEPKRKAAAFLEKVIRELGLDARVVLASGAQAAAQGVRAPNVVARALAAPSAALAICLPLVDRPGRILLTGSPDAAAPPQMRPERIEGPLDIVQTILMMDTPSPDIPDHSRERGV